MNTVKPGTDVAFECHAQPSTSRSLPMRSCKNAMVHYHDDSSSSDSDIYNYPEDDADTNLEEEEQPNLIESTKNSAQNELKNSNSEENDEENKDTPNDLNEKINQKFSEFKALKAKWEDDIKKAGKHEAVYYEEIQEKIQRLLDTWSSDKYEKLLTYVDDKIGDLERFLTGRGISAININTMPDYSIRQTLSKSDA